jgi:hypothetical protein
MTQDLEGMGFSEENNWGIGEEQWNSLSGVVQRERSHLKKTKPLAVTPGASYLRAG